jgi:enolase-phosphatase E1
VIRGILLDIEGTTTPISFVYDVLFPYARAHIHDPNMLRLMDEDSKTTELKELQGRIWLEGYRRGELRGEVFEDVPGALERWRREGIDVRIYSSGSVLAQKLLFGELTELLNGYFDTTTGAKGEAGSYVRIAAEFGVEPGEILFVSDVTRELDAARAAGMQTALCVRPGNPPQSPSEHPCISTFDEIETEV